MHIECLPDEIWLEIFDYIPYVDLFRCFTGLNQRIDHILSSKRIKLQIKSINHYKKFESLMKSLPEYIIGLSIKYHDQDIDISPYKNLHSLHLSHATIEQLTQIRSNYFQYLNQLSIVVNSHDHDYQLGDFIFSQNQLNSLTTCWFPNLDSYFDDNKTYQSCLTLRSLRLNYCNIKTFFKLLLFLPNLNNFESSLVPIFDQTISSFEHFNLIRLKIVLRANVPFSDLQKILVNLPCLEQFYLNINRRDILEDEFDLILLANFLENRLSTMKKCDIKINLFSNDLKINVDDLKNISPLFNQINNPTFQTTRVPMYSYRTFLSKKYSSSNK